MKIFYQAGFTLIEVVITLLGAMLVVFAIFTTFEQHFNATIQQQFVGEMNANGRLALNVLQRNLSDAGFEFRDDVAGVGLDPRLSLMQYDNVGAAAPNNAAFFPGGAGLPQSPYFASPVTLPPAVAGSDAIVVTTPYTQQLASGSLQSVCSYANIAISGANYVVCNTLADTKCSPLAALVTPTWWPSPGGLNDAPNKPSLLIEYLNGGTRVASSISISNVQFGDGGGACAGAGVATVNPITFTGTPQGLQVLPQAPGYALPPPPPPTVVTGALVNSYLYYLSSGATIGAQTIPADTLVRVAAGESNATHVALIQEISNNVETFQLQYADNAGGAPTDLIPADPGAADANFGTGDADTLNNTQRVREVRVALVTRAEKKDVLDKGSSHAPLAIYNFTPGSLTADGFRRRILARTVLMNNLRFLP